MKIFAQNVCVQNYYAGTYMWNNVMNVVCNQSFKYQLTIASYCSHFLALVSSPFSEHVM